MIFLFIIFFIIAIEDLQEFSVHSLLIFIFIILQPINIIKSFGIFLLLIPEISEKIGNIDILMIMFIIFISTNYYISLLVFIITCIIFSYNNKVPLVSCAYLIWLINNMIMY